MLGFGRTFGSGLGSPVFLLQARARLSRISTNCEKMHWSLINCSFSPTVLPINDAKPTKQHTEPKWESAKRNVKKPTRASLNRRGVRRQECLRTSNSKPLSRTLAHLLAKRSG